MKAALNSFKDWLDGQTWFPQRDNSNGGRFISSGELGAAEQPPHSFGCRMLWRRVMAEFHADWLLLKPRLWVIIPCLIFQYIHAIFTGMAYYMHEPLSVDNTTLHDLGFEALPFLDVDSVSEVLVYIGFAQFFLWLLSPFVTRHKSFSTSVVLKRVLVILVCCQALRILTFLSTQIPAPAQHCRAPEPTSNVPWPVWWQVIFVNVARQASKGCGDPIFSSHLTFLLIFAWTYCYLGRYLALKAYAFCYATVTALCIIASRKHYTVDVVVAAYVVPLVAFHFFRTWTHRRDDIATADSHGIVSLLAVALSPAMPQANGGGLEGGNATGGSKGRQVARQHTVVAAAGAAGLHEGDVHVDVEMAARSASRSAPAPEGSFNGQPKIPVKQTWSFIADLPRHIGSHTSVPPQHRRTESQEPVLSQEDYSTSISAL